MYQKTGKITFDGHSLDVYYADDDEPAFLAYDVMRMLGYSQITEVLALCEPDEVFNAKVTPVVDGFSFKMDLLTEHGLYNVLSQSRAVLARKWRKIIHQELINMRKEKDRDISQQFDYWNDMLDDLYFDEEKGVMMQSVTTQGGDVIQVPYRMEA